MKQKPTLTKKMIEESARAAMKAQRDLYYGKPNKAWCEVDNHNNIQKEAIGQFEIYDKKKNGSENPFRVDHSTKLVPCEIIIKLCPTTKKK